MGVTTSLRGNPGHRPTHRQIARALQATYAMDGAQALLELAPWGLTNFDTISWGPAPEQNHLILWGTNEVVILLRGLDSLAGIANTILSAGLTTWSVTGDSGLTPAVFRADLGFPIILTATNLARIAMGGGSFELTVAGHSMGGAIGQLVIKALQQQVAEVLPKPVCVTYGSPRTLSPNSAQDRSVIDIRVSLPYDPVPTIPPPEFIFPWPTTWPGLPGVTEFQHPGREFSVVPRPGPLLEVFDEQTFLSALGNGLAGLLTLTIVENTHFMGTYVSVLESDTSPSLPPTIILEAPIMPVTPQVDDGEVVEIIIHAHADDQQVLNVFHARAFDAILGGVEPAAIALGFLDKLRLNILNLLNPVYVVDKVQIRGVLGVTPGTPGPGQPHPFDWNYEFDQEVPSNPLDVGTDAGTPCSTFVAVTCKKITAFGSRYFRGGNRWAVITESETIDGGNTLDPTFRAQFKIGYTALLADLTVNGVLFPGTQVTMKFGVLSGTYLSWISPLSPVLDGFADITTVAVNQYTGSQVSRKRRASYA